MLKKIKWLLLGVASIGIIVVTYLVTLVRYAETEVDALETYRLSLEAMSEVVSVTSIHRFNGLETYIVASVIHESDQELYFFVQEGSVQAYFVSTQLITEAQAKRIAQDSFRQGEIIHTQLGILREMPIFEVQIKDEAVVHYLIINAQTGEIIMNFET